MFNDDFFWNLFERCGSLDAYMGYSHYRYHNNTSLSRATGEETKDL